MGTPENSSATINAQEQLGENLPAGDSVDWKAEAEKAEKGAEIHKRLTHSQDKN